MEPLLTAHQVAEILQVHVNWVWLAVRDNQIPHLRIGRTLRFRRDEIDGWLDRQWQPAA
ncbi:MAG: helix-turn-helix domain-containing protein [Gaiellaceae bacterium]